MTDYKAPLQSILMMMQELTGLEFAFFDQNKTLFAATPTYLERKGDRVHRSFLDEVIRKGQVLVTHPGKMPACIGCRFADHCPANLELLSCVYHHTDTVGVLVMSTFDEKGEKLIQNNLSVYRHIIETLSGLLEYFFYYFNLQKQNTLVKSALSAIPNYQDIFVLDKQGNLIHRQQEQAQDPCFELLKASHLSDIFGLEFLNRILSITSEQHLYHSGQTILATPLQDGYLLTTKKTQEKPLFDPNPLQDIITNDPMMKNIKESISRLATSNSSVLITGDTGTGKELVAKAIHQSGTRREKPFIAVNCANIPETLFESEFFGYVEGAFTGAKKSGKPGFFEQATEGTLFLDEIGELTPHQQAKLLRVLQDQEVQRLGGTKKVRVDVRVISATNRDLEELMHRGQFREDLYYRIQVVPLHLPNLTERPLDIKPLCELFIKKFNLIMGKKIIGIDQEAYETIEKYSWPGNVRELENCIEYAFNFCTGKTITKQDLPKKIRGLKPIALNPLDHEEAKLIESLLHTYGHTVEGKQKVAQQLNISLRTLYRKCKRYSLS